MITVRSSLQYLKISFRRIALISPKEVQGRLSSQRRALFFLEITTQMEKNSVINLILGNVIAVSVHA